MIKGMMKMKVGFITITVNDMEESLRFYQNIIKLKELDRFSPEPGVEIVFMQDEDKNLVELIEYKDVKQKELKSLTSRVSLGVVVESIEQIMEMLKDNKIEIVRGPVQTPAGVKFVFIEDPNGVEIEFIQGFNL